MRHRKSPNELNSSPQRHLVGCLLLLLLSPMAAAQEPPDILERMEVTRTVLDVRVVDTMGRPIEGLDKHDFVLKVGGDIIDLISCDWVDDLSPEPAELEPIGQPQEPVMIFTEDEPIWTMPTSQAPKLIPEGRLIVMFFQGSLTGFQNYALLRMAHRAKLMLDELEPTDYVAVASYVSHLKLQLDFSRDHVAIRDAIDRALFDREPPPQEPGMFPSMAADLDRATGKAVANPENALLHLAQPLQNIGGVKTLIFFGWGLGRFGKGGVRMTPNYGPAAQALVAARVTVFSLDISMCDYHSLEVGMKQVARDTGGFYEKCFKLPDQAVKKVRNAITGHYLLTFEPPESRRHRYRLSLKDRKGQILVKSSAYWD